MVFDDVGATNFVLDVLNVSDSLVVVSMGSHSIKVTQTFSKSFFRVVLSSDRDLRQFTLITMETICIKSLQLRTVKVFFF